MSSPDPQKDPFSPVIIPHTHPDEEREEMRLEKIMQNAKEQEEQELKEAEKWFSLDLTKDI